MHRVWTLLCVVEGQKHYCMNMKKSALKLREMSINNYPAGVNTKPRVTELQVRAAVICTDLCSYSILLCCEWAGARFNTVYRQSDGRSAPHCLWSKFGFNPSSNLLGLQEKPSQPQLKRCHVTKTRPCLHMANTKYLTFGQTPNNPDSLASFGLTKSMFSRTRLEICTRRSETTRELWSATAKEEPSGKVSQPAALVRSEPERCKSIQQCGKKNGVVWRWTTKCDPSHMTRRVWSS